MRVLAAGPFFVVGSLISPIRCFDRVRNIWDARLLFIVCFAVSIVFF